MLIVVFLSTRQNIRNSEINIKKQGIVWMNQKNFCIFATEYSNIKQ